MIQEIQKSEANPIGNIAPDIDALLTNLAQQMADISTSVMGQWHTLAQTQAEEMQRKLESALDQQTTQALNTLDRSSTSVMSSIDRSSTDALAKLEGRAADTVALSLKQIEEQIEQQRSQMLAATADLSAQTMQQIEQFRQQATSQTDAEIRQQVVQSRQQIEQQKAETLDLLRQQVAQIAQQIERHRDDALGQMRTEADAIRRALTEERERLSGEIQQQLEKGRTEWERYTDSALQALGKQLNASCTQLEARANALQRDLDRHREGTVAHVEAITEEVNTHKSIIIDAGRANQQTAEQIEAMQRETLAARDQMLSTVREIQNTIDGIKALYGEVRATASQNAMAVQQVHALANQAQQGKQDVAEEIAKVQEQFDRIMRVDTIMSALDGAVKKIYAASTPSGSTTGSPAARVDTPTAMTSVTSATQPRPITTTPIAETASVPPTVETQPRTASPTVTAPEPPAALPLPPSLTPGTSAFSFLARFTQFVNIQWVDVVAAVETNEPRFFTNRRLQDLDLILYGDIHSLLKASGEPISEALAAELELARTQYRQQLTEAGMVRIEGTPGDRVKAYWLEADPNESVPTTDQSLDGTYADIVPGNAGYLLRQRAIKPTIARFYKLM